MQPVTSLCVKSVIATPLDGAQVVTGKLLTIRGVAWAGDAGPVSAVDVSVANGRAWKPASLDSRQRTQFGWRQWEFNWTPPQEAYYTILARARDQAGNTQPLHQEWNPSGYLWNVVPRVGVDSVQKLSAKSSPAQPARSSIAAPTVLQNACIVCHEDDVIRGQRLTRAQWDRELKKMTGWGAQVKDADRDGLLEYLFTNYAPCPRGR